MRKLMGLCLFMLLMIFSILSFINYSYDSVESIERDKETITINKPINESNNQFLKNIDAALQKIGADIMYRYIDVSNEKPIYYYYKTNNSKDFISSQIMNWNIDNNESISTIKQEEYKTYFLKVSPLFQDIVFLNWNHADNYDLSNGIFYVKREEADKIANEIMNLGYTVTVNKTTYISGKLSIPLFSFVPSFLMILSVSFYVLSNGKKNMIKKMEGYKTYSILIDELKENKVMFLGVFIFVEAVTISSAIILLKKAIFNYLYYSIQYLIALFFIIFFAIMVSYVLIITQVGIEYIKGMVPKTGIYYLSMLAKFIFVVFISFFMSIAVRNIIISYNTYNTSKFLAEKIDGYVNIPIYENNTSSEGLDDAYSEFYNYTVDRYNGVLINSSNYEYSLISGKTASIKYGQDDIVINENYLEFNPIYQNSDNIITKDMLIENKVNILLPISKENRKEEYCDNIKMWFSEDANFILYDDSITNIYSYNARTGNNYGKIESPIIIVANDKVLDAGMLKAYFSKGSYFIKVNGDNPYLELVPLLEKTGLISVTPQTPYISSNFDSVLNQQLKMLILYGSETLILSIGLFFLIIFSAKIYCENYRKKIACCLIEGYNLLKCIDKHLLLIIINYLLCIISAIIIGQIMNVAINLYIPIITFVIEEIVTILLCNRFTKENLYQIQKGAE